MINLNKVLSNLQPPVKLTPTEWANRYRILSGSTSAEPGRYSTKRIPYVEEILNLAVDPKIETIVVMKSAQVGLTEALLCLVGFYCDNTPGPMLYLMPTASMATDLSKDRLSPMFQECPVLKGKIDTSHLSGNTILHKSFPGGTIILSGSNSPSSLSSRPVSKLFLDEVDRFTLSAGKEGSPVDLATKRTATFKNRKIYLISTPTVRGVSIIEKSFNESDKRYFNTPCPYCGLHQVLRWENVKYQDDDPATARYCCCHCQKPWSDLQRWKAIEKGHWQATAPTLKIAGFHLNELMSPWSTVKEITTRFLIAKRGGSETLKVWTNTSLGETFDDNTERSKADYLMKRAEPIHVDALPNSVLILTAGADTQGDRIEISVVGYGLNQEAWVIEHLVVYGNPNQTFIFTEVEKLLSKRYQTEDGRILNISSTCIDSGGHSTLGIYSFSAQQLKKGNKVYAIKGINGDRLIWEGKTRKSKTHKGSGFYLIGVDTLKEAVFSRLKIEVPGERYIHFSDKLGKQYFDQLVSEYPVWVLRRGRPFKRWLLADGDHNESFDCLNYSLASLHSIMSEYDRLCQAVKLDTKPNVKKSSYLDKHRY